MFFTNYYNMLVNSRRTNVSFVAQPAEVPEGRDS